jgi:hypothetical protein
MTLKAVLSIRSLCMSVIFASPNQKFDFFRKVDLLPQPFSLVVVHIIDTRHQIVEPVDLILNI